ncbi:DUF945 family protein [Vibrio hannami]|uniref:DUF945 family protein n=1 Tax=Vibrio hannami TaxID=2717094 RepID=UPI00241028A8|nr:DUF945 family protein [Vibrio hannami]MDG3087969.1 DUF945 family protein [Vibrio hannami]
MKSLKKIGAIGGAIVLAACWPLAVGQIGQTVMKDGIAELSNQQVEAEVVEYDRGYLSSVAKTRYEITDPALKQQFIADGLPTTFVVKHNISHGLLGIDAVSTPENVDALPITLNTHTQLNGNTDFSLDIENLNFVDENNLGGSVSVSRSRITGNATVLGELKFAFSFPSIQVSFETGEKLAFTDLTGSGEGKKNNGFWHGEQHVNLGDVALETATGQMLVSGQNLGYHFVSSLNEAGDRIQTNHKLTADKFLNTEGEIQDLNVDFTLGQLDTDAFESLVDIYQNHTVLTDAVLNQSAPHIDNLFDKGFELSMNQMKLSLGQGVFDSKWKLVVPQGTSDVSKDLSKVIPALTGKLDTFISNGLVTEYPFIQEGIDELVIMEMIKPVEDGYKIDATVEDGNIVFESGQKMPLIALLFPMIAR